MKIGICKITDLKKIEGIIFALFICGVLFFTSKYFVEKEALPKKYFFSFCSLILGGVAILNTRKPIRLNWLTILVTIFIVYLILVSAFTSFSNLGIIPLIGFILFFLFFYSSNISSKFINISIIGSCVLQAEYGLLQYFHLVYSSSNFPIVGSYDNPAGFAACLAVSFPLVFTLAKYSTQCKIFALFSGIIMAIAVSLSESRAGVISIIIVSLIFVFYQLSNRLTKYKRYILPSLMIVGIVIFVILLSFKKNSALGRLFIWQVTREMIMDNPVFGGGSGSFLAKYMEYQADFFIMNPESKYTLLADNVLHPFNEYLLLVTEYGFVGFILLSTCLLIIVRSNKLPSPYLLCLLSLGVFSLFSYPLKYPFTWVISAYCLAQISRKNKSIISLLFPTKVWFKLSVIIFLVIGITFLAKDLRFEYHWNKVAKVSLLGQTREMLPKYEKLHKNWNGNHLFLYNYGAELNHIGEYEQSLIIFEECVKYWNDYDIQMVIADNYTKLQDWHNAEKHYKLAANMCPNRFIPLYKLHEINLSQKKYQEANTIALMIVNKEVKIPSPTIYSIVNKMNEYLDRNIK